MSGALTAGPRAAWPAWPADATLEAEVLAHWRAHEVEARHLQPPAAGPGAPLPPFVFYEGPPTANGRPAIHHVFSRTLKDSVCRHRRMLGHHVPRKAGWDTQGLPVEIEVQKKLGISTRDEIEALVKDAAGRPDREASIAEFNRLCRESVFTYKKDWEELSRRMAYWLDYEHPYMTCAPGYIESCWAILARFHRAGLLTKDFKVLPYCPRCQTGLSNHEVAQGYEDVQDPSVYVRFRVQDAEWQLRWRSRARDDLAALSKVSLLVWTTTPWTLLANVAIAAHAELEYALARVGDEHFVLARPLVEGVLGPQAQVVATIPGSELKGLPYERPFENVALVEQEARRPRSRTVELADYVSATDGTGLVHTAPAFGEDDFALRKLYHLPIPRPVDDQVRFTQEVATDAFGQSLVGRFVKDADKDIIRELKQRGLLWKQETLQHAYPHCWRCRSPLIYMARPSWYLRTTALKERLVTLNARIDWHPPEMGAGRFGEWLENNVDWAISRERYWGTPLNVWICDVDGNHRHAPESFAELRALGATQDGEPIPVDFDPHRPQVDHVTFRCSAPGCPGTLRRTPEVIDCWFDSGAMPFAQAGWPASSPDRLPDEFPADFISEGLDQTRGWFYTLHALATFVTGLPEFAADVAARSGGKSPEVAGLPAYRSVLVNNLVLDAQGKKMSKSVGNVVDPWRLFDSVGVDAVRWFFLVSGQVWTPKRFDEKALVETARRTFGTLANCYAFLALYAALDGWRPGDAAPPPARRASIDRWLLSRLQTLTRDVGVALDALDLTEACRQLDAFIDRELSNWYVRRNRARFWKGGDAEDQRAAYATLAEALERVALLLAPLAPCRAEWLWRAVAPHAAGGSVHLQRWPAADVRLVDAELERRMAVVLDAVDLGRRVRAAHDLKTRQPLASVKIKAADPADAARLSDPELARLVREELNVRAVEIVESADFRTLSAKADFKRLGPRLGPRMKEVAAAIAALDERALEAFAASGRLELAGELLDRQDVVLVEKGREGYAVAGDGRLVLALDTRLDDDLLDEGRAREIVNRVQNTRKAAGLDVSDRIVVSLSGDGALLAAARRHEALILGEVLGVKLHTAEQAAPGAQAFDVDGARLGVGVEKVDMP